MWEWLMHKNCAGEMPKQVYCAQRGPAGDSLDCPFEWSVSCCMAPANSRRVAGALRLAEAPDFLPASSPTPHSGASAKRSAPATLPLNPANPLRLGPFLRGALGSRVVWPFS